MKLHSSGLEWTKIDKINTVVLNSGRLAPINTIYRLLVGGSLATNVGSFFRLFWQCQINELSEVENKLKSIALEMQNENKF
jgi:hypothetical protein